MSDVTQILHHIKAGDPTAADLLLLLVCDELPELAAVRLSQEKPGQTLQATGLVHEACLRLVGPLLPARIRNWNTPFFRQQASCSQPETLKA
jgi:hypothetical protein